MAEKWIQKAIKKPGALRESLGVKGDKPIPAKKLAAAVGVGVGLAVLGAVGYTPNVQQTETVRLTLRVLYALVPSLCNLLAIGIALYYPISGDMHGRIRAAIDRRLSGESVSDPLKPARTIV